MSMHEPRSIRESGGDSGDFLLSDLPRAFQDLEADLHDLLSNFWEEPSLSKARATAAALSEVCEPGHFREAQVLLRTLRSLLALSFGDAAAIRIPLTEKCDELVLLLKEEFSREARPVPGDGRPFGTDRGGHS